MKQLWKRLMSMRSSTVYLCHAILQMGFVLLFTWDTVTIARGPYPFLGCFTITLAWLISECGVKPYLDTYVRVKELEARTEEE